MQHQCKKEVGNPALWGEACRPLVETSDLKFNVKPSRCHHIALRLSTFNKFRENKEEEDSQYLETYFRLIGADPAVHWEEVSYYAHKVQKRTY